MIYILVAVAYIAGTIVFWRGVSFSGSRRALFSVTIIPIFFGAMLFDIWVVDTFAPSLMGAFEEAKAHDARAAARGVRLRASAKQEPVTALAISTPIALFITYWWYVFFRRQELNATRKPVDRNEKAESLPDRDFTLPSKTLPISAIRSAAEGGDADAQYRLAVMYYKGQDMEKDLNQATVWCRRAVEQGHVDAKFMLDGLKRKT